VADEVVLRFEEACHELAVRLEVHARDRGARREAGALDDDEVEALGQRTLLAPGRSPAEDAAVDEHEPLHQAESTRVTNIVRFGSKKRNGLLQTR
jgi:hypothetical protein